MRYPRCFIVVTNDIPPRIFEQLLQIRGDGQNTYIPFASKTSKIIDQQIAIIKKIDEELEDRYQSVVVVMRGKEIDIFTLMILADYSPKIYWVDSGSDFKKIRECSQNFDDYSQMERFLMLAEQRYWVAYERIKTISPQNVFRDEFFEGLLFSGFWRQKSNAESATRVWIKSELKAGVVKRLDL